MSHKLAKRIIIPLNVFSIGAGTLLTFGLEPKLMGALCILCVLISWVLLFRFPDRFSLDSSKSLKKKGLEGQYCSVECSMGVSLAFTTINLLKSNTPANWWEPIVLSAILTVALLILVLRFLSERDIGRGDLIAYAILFGLLHIGCIWQANLLLDFKEPQCEQVIVQTVDSSRSSKGGTTYYIKAELDGEELRINIPRAQWVKLEEGDTVTIAIHHGGLGMEYYTLEEP